MLATDSGTQEDIFVPGAETLFQTLLARMQTSAARTRDRIHSPIAESVVHIEPHMQVELKIDALPEHVAERNDLRSAIGASNSVMQSLSTLAKHLQVVQTSMNVLEEWVGQTVERDAQVQHQFAVCMERMSQTLERVDARVDALETRVVQQVDEILAHMGQEHAWHAQAAPRAEGTDGGERMADGMVAASVQRAAPLGTHRRSARGVLRLLTARTLERR